MGLLRASADAIVVGARTVRDVSAKSLWTPEYAYPDAKHLYAEYRANKQHKTQYPLLVIVSGSGQLELERAIFRSPAKCATMVITTTSACAEKMSSRAEAVRLEAPLRYML